ncbi:MAG: AI-2E family transporter [Segetibacter sp.]
MFSFLFAIALLPVAGFFETKLKLSRSAASGLSVILLFTFISLILYFVGSQISDLAKDWPMFKEAFADTLTQIQNWVTLKFHIDVNKQMKYVHNETQKMLAESAGVIGATVVSLSSVLLFLVFIMIDTFFLLFYRRLIVKFLIAVFTEENSVIVYDIIAQVEFIIRKYILGLLLEMGIVAVVCCLAFLIIGVKYAILLGLLTGLFNIIPYIGIFTSLVLSTIITIGTAAATAKVVLVIVTIVAMHLIDSNILLPVIVGAKVKINALITVIGVIVGEMFWGIPGMFLALPIIAISKVVFDRIESLKPWGMLLGDEKDEEQPGKLAEEVKNNPEMKPQEL